MGPRNFYGIAYFKAKGEIEHWKEPWMNGQRLDIQEIIRGGKTFGIFDSHAMALNTFRYR